MRVSDNYRLRKHIKLYRNSYLSAYGDKPRPYEFNVVSYKDKKSGYPPAMHSALDGGND